MDLQEVNTQFSSGQMHNQGIQKFKNGKQTAHVGVYRPLWKQQK